MPHRAPDDGVWVVGRAAELDDLDEYARAATAGQPWSVLIEGEAGVGRTALLRRFLTQEPHATVWWAGCDVVEADVPYGLVSQLHRHVDRSADRPHPWSERVPATVGPVDVGMQVLRAIETVAREHLLIIVVDDANWVDEPSLAVLGYVLRRLQTGRVLVVFSLRAGGGGPTPVRAVEEGLRHIVLDREYSAVLSLAGLTSEDVCQLAEHIGLPVEMPVATRLRDYVRGNPRYVLDVLHGLRSPGRTVGRGGLPLPAQVAAHAHRLLAGLPGPSRRLLAALAVLDACHPLSIVAGVAGVPDAPVHLRPLLSGGFVHWWPEDPGTPIAIDSTLHRDAVYRSLEPVLRQEMHAAVALRADRSAALAHRVAASSGPDDGLADELELACSDATRAGDVDRAADLLLWAADMTGDRDRHEHRLLTAAAHLTWYRRWERLHDLRPRIEACAHDPLRSLALGALAHSHGRLAAAESLLTEARVLAAGDPDLRPVMLRAWLSLTRSCAWRDHGHLEGLIARWILAEQGLDRQARNWAAFHASDSDGRRGDGPFVALRTMRLLAPLSIPPVETSGQDALLLAVHGTWQARAGRLTEAVRTLTALEQHAREDSVDELFASTRSDLAFAHHLLGDWEPALAAAAEAVALTERDDVSWSRSFVYGVAACVHAPTGQFTRAADLARASRRWWRPASTRSEVSYPALAAATIAQAHADHPAMLAALRPILDLPATSGHARYFQLWWRPLQVEALIGAGDLPDAEEALLGLVELAERIPALGSVVGWLDGWLAERHGDQDDARIKYEAAMSGVGDTEDIPLHRARLEHAYGRLLLGRGSRRAAISQLRSAFERYSILGAQPFLQRCANDLAASGLRVTTGQATGPLAVLSAKEHRVAHLVAAGLTNQQVAKEIYISVKTVEFHLGNIFAKLGISSRKDLGALVAGQDATEGRTSHERLHGPAAVDEATA